METPVIIERELRELLKYLHNHSRNLDMSWVEKVIENVRDAAHSTPPASAHQKGTCDNYFFPHADLGEDCKNWRPVAAAPAVAPTPQPKKWSEACDKVQPCGHTWAQHEYFLSKALELNMKDCPAVAGGAVAETPQPSPEQVVGEYLRDVLDRLAHNHQDLAQHSDCPRCAPQPSDERAAHWYPFALRIIRQAAANRNMPIIGNTDEVEARELAGQMAQHERR